MYWFKIKDLNISLQELENERAVDVRGLLVALQMPILIITFFVIHKIFGIIKIFSDQLKAKSPILNNND